MLKRRWILALVALIVAVIGIALGLQNLTTKQSPVALTERFENSESFHFSYPADWQYIIPEQNIIFLASPEVLNQEAGASITIQRSLRLMTEVETLAAALDLFLERGPLAESRSWEVVEAAQATEVNGRDALVAVLEGAEFEDSQPLHSEITVTRSDSGIFYVFAASASVEQWPEVEGTIQAILDSVTILE